MFFHKIIISKGCSKIMLINADYIWQRPYELNHRA